MRFDNAEIDLRPASPRFASCWSCGIESWWEDWTFAEGRSGEMVSVSPSPGVAVAGYGMVVVDASAVMCCRFGSGAGSCFVPT